MNAVLIVLAVLLALALAHPVAAAVVIGAELAACAALSSLVWRARRPCLYPHWRTA